MRSSNLLLLLLLVLAVLTWLLAIHPERAEPFIHYLRSYRPPPKPPVTVGELHPRDNLLATMHRTYDDDLYDFVCVERWTGTVALTVRPVLSDSEGKAK